MDYKSLQHSQVLAFINKLCQFPVKCDAMIAHFPLSSLLRYSLFASLLAKLLFAAPAQACAPAREACVEVGKWDISLGVGAGVRSNPLADTADIPLLLVPQVNYSGERFFIQNLDLGFTLWETSSQQLNLLATPSYDQVFFQRWSPANFFIDNGFATAGKQGGDDNSLPLIDEGSGNNLLTPEFKDIETRQLRDRHLAGLAGFEYSWNTDLVDVQIQYLSDFTRVHSGEELRLTLSKHWRRGKHQWLASVGANWQSGEVINYYYGVTEAEADWRGSYSAEGAISPLLRLEWNYQLNERWDLRLLSSYRALPDEISASPLMNDNKVITVFLGGVYHF